MGIGIGILAGAVVTDIAPVVKEGRLIGADGQPFIVILDPAGYSPARVDNSSCGLVVFS